MLKPNSSHCALESIYNQPKIVKYSSSQFLYNYSMHPFAQSLNIQIFTLIGISLACVNYYYKLKRNHYFTDMTCF